MKSSPKKQLDDFIKEIEAVKGDGFMGRVDKSEEVKYLLHNKDRFLAALEDLDEIIASKPGKISLLDIGTSPITFIIKKRFPRVDVTTLDITDNLAGRCRKAGIHFAVANLNNPKDFPFNKKYDVIVFLEVLEHLKSDHRKVMGWISAILKKGGVCLLQTPNKYSPKAIAIKFMGLGWWDFLSKRPDIPEEFAHFKEYSLPELTSLVKQFPKFKITRAEHSLYFDTVDSASVYRRFVSLTRPMLITNKYIVTVLPLLRRGMQLIFVKE